MDSLRVALDHSTPEIKPSLPTVLVLYTLLNTARILHKDSTTLNPGVAASTSRRRASTLLHLLRHLIRLAHKHEVDGAEAQRAESDVSR